MKLHDTHGEDFFDCVKRERRGLNEKNSTL